jgi:hypothetical protein
LYPNKPVVSEKDYDQPMITCQQSPAQKRIATFPQPFLRSEPRERLASAAAAPLPISRRRRRYRCRRRPCPWTTKASTPSLPFLLILGLGTGVHAGSTRSTAGSRASPCRRGRLPDGRRRPPLRNMGYLTICHPYGRHLFKSHLYFDNYTFTTFTNDRLHICHFC